MARPATVRLWPNPRQRNGKNLRRSHPKNRVELRPRHGRGSRAIQAPEALHELAQPEGLGYGLPISASQFPSIQRHDPQQAGASPSNSHSRDSSLLRVSSYVFNIANHKSIPIPVANPSCAILPAHCHRVRYRSPRPLWCSERSVVIRIASLRGF